MIGGFEDPTAGTIYLGDRDVTDLPAYKRDVNTVFQSYALFPHLSIFENVAFGLRRKGVHGEDLRRRADDALELVDLAGLGKRKPRQLSGGQQQRVALARALVNRPRVLLLDEPLGALDLKLRKQMQLELKRIQHEVGITFVHVTHDQEEAMTMADRIAVMNTGRVDQLGTPTELYERPATAFVAGFLGVSNLLTGRAEGDGAVGLDSGVVIRVPGRALGERRGSVAVGIRPEKIRVLSGGASANGENVLEGTVVERSYVGVATQYVVETPAGPVTVYQQNAAPETQTLSEGDRASVAWSPDATFVVDAPEEESR
jgi:spermidine/putrescine transport system ATP-binding protein